MTDEEVEVLSQRLARATLASEEFFARIHDAQAARKVAARQMLVATAHKDKEAANDYLAVLVRRTKDLARAYIQLGEGMRDALADE